MVGAWRGKPEWMSVARPAVAGQFVFVAMAFGCLVYSFVNNDFSVLYVARNSNSHLPLFYKVAALWGAHEGSLLLWISILSIWSLAVAAFSRQLPASFSSRVLGVMGLVSGGFMLFTLWTSNPFERLMPAAQDGADLNPVLQDFALAIHPPMLYTGYVGFSVAFAFACAAMLEGKLDQTWAKWTRPWTIFAWVFQTIGIALGSWWAYYELGWGGWWFWDPVENASFMPWLVGTALIHSLSVTEKRGIFKSWTLLLAIFAFSLSLVGTFLVRSGVLVSVHSFATDPTRGLYILAFLVITIGGSLTLYAWRAPKLYVPGGFEPFSREFFLLVNNVILVSVAGLVLWGTLSPLVYELLNIGKISVGPPVFAVMFLVPMLPLMIFLAIGMHSVWRRGKLTITARPIWWMLAAAVLLALVLQLGYGKVHPVGLVGDGVRHLDHFLRAARAGTAPAPGTDAHGRPDGHGDRACRRRDLRHRRERRGELQDRKGRRAQARNDLRHRGIRFSLRQGRRRAGSELRCGAGHRRGHARRQARDDARAAEAPFLGAADRQQPGGDLGELGARLVRRDGQPLGGGRLEHAHPVQAAGALHLAGRDRHGAGRHRGGDRSALSRRA